MNECMKKGRREARKEGTYTSTCSGPSLALLHDHRTTHESCPSGEPGIGTVVESQE
jgi:hypothetical protein